MTARQAKISRKTNETETEVFLDLDSVGSNVQTIEISTGIGFLDHVLELISWSSVGTFY